MPPQPWLLADAGHVLWFEALAINGHCRKLSTSEGITKGLWNDGNGSFPCRQLSQHQLPGSQANQVGVRCILSQDYTLVRQPLTGIQYSCNPVLLIRLHAHAIDVLSCHVAERNSISTWLWQQFGGERFHDL